MARALLRKRETSVFLTWNTWNCRFSKFFSLECVETIALLAYAFYYIIFAHGKRWVFLPTHAFSVKYWTYCPSYSSQLVNNWEKSLCFLHCRHPRTNFWRGDLCWQFVFMSSLTLELNSVSKYFVRWHKRHCSYKYTQNLRWMFSFASTRWLSLPLTRHT